MRASFALIFLVASGCGSPNPCEGQAGACITLTVTSSSVSRLDALELMGFGSTRTSMSGETSLPVQLAVIPPAGTPEGTYEIAATARLGGVARGSGTTMITVAAGHSSAILQLFAVATGGDGGGGQCSAPTPDECAGKCVNLQSDPQNCKECGKVCSYPMAGATCSSGACQIAACESGYQDCSGGPADGCETYLATDAANCGACGKKCLLGQICNNGVCTDDLVNCSTPGVTCIKDGCTTGTFAVSAGGDIVVDTAAARRLWTRATRGPSTYSAAKADCLGLALEGVTGWTLPATYQDVPQYMTGGLQGCPVCNPAIDQAAFPDTPAASMGYWTASYDANAMGYHVVDFCDGRDKYFEMPSTPLPYRCTHDPL